MSLATNGQVSSATALGGALTSIRSSGTSVLSLLNQIQLTTLVDFDRALTGLQSRQQRAQRVKAHGIAALFVTSDFGSIDQGQTTATVRIDTAAATLRERRYPAEALVTSTSFTASAGSVVALSADQTLLSVTSSVIPTGTFTMELQQAVDLSVLTLSLAAMASNPSVSIQVSSDGLVYAPAANLSLVGSSLNAWFASTPVKFIQLVITPTHADNLDGNTYTFGITGFSGTTSSYDLVSDVYFRPASFSPTGANVVFRAEDTGDVIYYLKLDNGSGSASYVPVSDGSVLSVPGVAATTLTNVAIDGTGNLQTIIPANAYLNTLTVTDQTTGVVAPLAAGTTSSSSALVGLPGKVCTISNGNLYVVPTTSSSSDRYTISYLAGPAAVTATLIAHLSTSDRTQTPVFKGASLEAQ